MSPPVRADAEEGSFTASRERFESVLGFLRGTEAAALSHAELETRLDTDGRALLRQLFSDHLELRALRERRVQVVDADGSVRGRVEHGHTRVLATMFGEVGVARLAYRSPGQPNLHPADAGLNLPEQRHSHGLRRLAAIESSRGSFDDAVQAIERATGQQLGKRQTEKLAGRTAVDFDAFYAQRKPPPGATDDVLVLTCDGKGVVMRPDALRPATATAAAKATPKLATRLSKGEKRNRKRMAEVGGVYDVTPIGRTVTDILPSNDENHVDTPGPTAVNKWLIASVVDDTATVISQVFAEADRRDPTHRRPTIALVDGNSHQIERIEAEAKARSIEVTIIIDLIHVLEYLWKAAWCFHDEGNPAAEAWIRDKATAVLGGQARQVAATIRRQATRQRLGATKRKGADSCANYLTSKSPYLDYPTALERGWPIATGIIEGACRHLVKDRMDLTGARWGLDGAETILKLRALRINGDWNEYWDYHLTQEQQRIHLSRYADNAIPQAA